MNGKNVVLTLWLGALDASRAEGRVRAFGLVPWEVACDPT